MIQINTLYSLENVQDFYYLDEKNLEIVNILTKKTKTISINKRGYPVVYLQRKDRIHQQNVPMHKIVALALIKNAPYKVIEHKNDNKLDYRPENLTFSNQKNNALRAFDNKKRIVSARVFKVVTIKGMIYTGTIREISKKSGISVGTLYDNFLYRCKDGNCTEITQKKSGIFSIVEIGVQTIERHTEYDVCNE